MALGVRHEAEDQAGLVADASNAIDRAIRVFADVGEGDLLRVMEGEADRFIPRDEFAFAMGNGQFELLDSARPNRFAVLRGKRDPLVDETMGNIVGERAGLPGMVGEIWEEIGFDEDLKAIADADDGFSPASPTNQVEVARRVCWRVICAAARIFPGGDVAVAVGGPAGDGEAIWKLLPPEYRGAFEEAVDVDGFGRAAGELESVSRLGIAIGAGGAEDEDVGRHGKNLVMGGMEARGTGKTLNDKR